MQLSAYVDVHEIASAARTGRVRTPGNPKASRSAMVKIVDADDPPLRVFFGDAPPNVAKDN